MMTMIYYGDLVQGDEFKDEITKILADGKVEYKEIVALALQVAKKLETTVDENVKSLKGAQKCDLVCSTLRVLLTKHSTDEELLSKALSFVESTVPYALQAAVSVANGFNLKEIKPEVVVAEVTACIPWILSCFNSKRA